MRLSERIITSFFEIYLKYILPLFFNFVVDWSTVSRTQKCLFLCTSILFRTGVARNCIYHAPRDGKGDKSRYSESEREIAADIRSACKGTPWFTTNSAPRVKTEVFCEKSGVNVLQKWSASEVNDQISTSWHIPTDISARCLERSNNTLASVCVRVRRVCTCNFTYTDISVRVAAAAARDIFHFRHREQTT